VYINIIFNYYFETSYDPHRVSVQNALRSISPLLLAQDIRALVNLRTFDFGRRYLSTLNFAVSSDWKLTILVTKENNSVEVGPGPSCKLLVVAGWHS